MAQLKKLILLLVALLAGAGAVAMAEALKAAGAVAQSEIDSKVLVHDLHIEDDGVHQIMLKVNGRVVHQINLTKEDGGVHDAREELIRNLTATVQQLKDANATSAAQASMTDELYRNAAAELDALKKASLKELITTLLAVGAFLVDMVFRFVDCMFRKPAHKRSRSCSGVHSTASISPADSESQLRVVLMLPGQAVAEDGAVEAEAAAE